MQQNKSQYYLKLAIALLLWAGLYHVAKPAAEMSDPYMVAFIRYLVSAFLFLLILKYKLGYFIPKLAAKQWLLVSLIGIIGVFAYNLLFFSAEALISGNIVAILYAFTPCLTTMISAYVFKTKLNWLSKLGVIIAMLGSIGVVNFATPECGKFFCSNIFTSINRGEVYGILATCAFAGYSVLSKYTSLLNVPALVMNAYASLLGCILLGITALFKANFQVLPQLGSSFWLAILYMSVLATVLGYLWYTDAIINLGVFKTVVVQNTIPLQTVLIGYIFFQEKIGLGTLFCGLMILSGVYLTNLAFGLKAPARNSEK